MQPRNVALVGAAVGAGFGVVGLIVPGFFATLFGMEQTATTTALIRALCASYVGIAALDWAARNVTDAAAWRAIAVGNATGWAISGVVYATALVSGLGNSIAWSIVALQFAMTLLWLSLVARSGGVPISDMAKGSSGQ
jgi:hypothetical protein